MDQNEFDTLDHAIDGVARHVSRALIAMEDMRRSGVPDQREAYREVHDLMGDLGSMKVRLGCMDPARGREGLTERFAHVEARRR